MSDRMDLVMDFTHTYGSAWVEDMSTLCYLDCSDIGGTDMYCTPEAEEELARRIGRYPLEGIHFIDSGNYHYMTALFTRRIRKPYNLVFFDNHSDMQPTLVPELMSCGAWAKQVLEEDGNLCRMVLIGPSEQTIREICEGYGEKLICVSRESLELASLECVEAATQKPCEPEKSGRGSLRMGPMKQPLYAVLDRLDGALPLYLSIDKDVLSEEYARTNWDQGEMSLPVLKGILEEICERFRVIGADICGQLPDAPTWQEAETRRVNEETDRELYRLLRGMDQ